MHSAMIETLYAIYIYCN